MVIWIMPLLLHFELKLTIMTWWILLSVGVSFFILLISGKLKDKG